MTNRDWLNGLSNNELVEWLLSPGFEMLKMAFTQTDAGLKEWLDKEYYPGYYAEPVVFNKYDFVPDSCKNCSNHPSNGGSGFCNCTLGLSQVVY